MVVKVKRKKAKKRRRKHRISRTLTQHSNNRDSKHLDINHGDRQSKKDSFESSDDSYRDTSRDNSTDSRDSSEDRKHLDNENLDDVSIYVKYQRLEEDNILLRAQLKTAQQQIVILLSQLNS